MVSILSHGFRPTRPTKLDLDISFSLLQPCADLSSSPTISCTMDPFAIASKRVYDGVETQLEVRRYDRYS